MRSLVLHLLLVSAFTQADSIVTPEQRKQEIAVAASEAAAGLGRTEYYVEYLVEPMPKQLLQGSEMQPYVLFGKGWGEIQPWGGVWSLDQRSTLSVRLTPGQRPKKLYIHGKYHKQAEATRLLVNGQLLSEAPLHKLTVEIPQNLVTDPQLTIELQHLHPSPAMEEKAGGEDAHIKKFGLMQLRVW